MVCGTGGVGKTSIAASIAVNEALRGRRVCVLTIDPAKRLADAMGLSKLDDRERKVKLPAGGVRGGELWALMLDPKQAFDRLVSETADDPEQQARVLENRVYQAVSRSTAGVQEYMALERLYELDRVGKYDLIVVDTPPSAHARDLLESPVRMLRFLEGRSLRWFLKPGMKMGRFGLKAIGGPGGAVVGLLTRVTGVEMLRDTTEFFESMEGMYDHIRERIALVDRMFADERTGFLVVASPERSSIDQAIDFWDLIAERRLSFTGSVVNRVEPTAGDEVANIDDLLGLPGIDRDLAARLVACQQDHFAVAARDESRLDELRSAIADAPVIGVPRLPRMINDLAGLADLKQYLYS
ncbi:MAG: ArsA family ATPase [Thermoleophilia bacterium]|nr:ArsA family ATPase [Thermoleophilia bacterium]